VKEKFFRCCGYCYVVIMSRTMRRYMVFDNVGTWKMKDWGADWGADWGDLYGLEINFGLGDFVVVEISNH